MTVVKPIMHALTDTASPWRCSHLKSAMRCRAFSFLIQVKPDKLADYKRYHDAIFPEVSQRTGNAKDLMQVAAGLRAAGLKQLTTFQLPGTNRLVMV